MRNHSLPSIKGGNEHPRKQGMIFDGGTAHHQTHHIPQRFTSYHVPNQDFGFT